MATEDIPSGLQLCRDANWNQMLEDWCMFLDFPGSGACLAEQSSITIGTVAYLRYGVFTWISMMLVDFQYRGKGIGSRLFEEVLDILKNDSCARLDATPLGEPLYRKYGFEKEYELARMTTVTSGQFSPTAGTASPMQEADLADVFQKDRTVFGADRSRLLGSLYHRSPACAWIVRDSNAIHGYTFGRPGHRYYQLGPIVAEKDHVAQEMIQHCLSQQPGRSFAIDTPKLTPEWLNWLASVGFVNERPFVRMALRKQKEFGLLSLQYGITGPEFG